ncbi:MAG: hypothetical protein RIE06_16165 [Roseibium album]|uniref:Putative membrane protein n=1 Tax=Roseibium album TaxID=311410 RepID=A0A0M6ZNS9_9HYPH|nr:MULTISPECIES: DUF4870 domain-containing protein [Stappiaceae]MBG6146250.1 putative membrane protein [Labrenzia sp. EL_142]MBG6154890.1 putative membrane protein [Labrenzia sp. EL_162]MBG6162148.1 putative membrane protein [Labrenzia sp. EL_195]MBG6174134.1 putative membrane protein [Labrenzia sp. EL_132]MBG6192980.1 putative membrane protein [Labrenzia sp. EL_159]MBG6199367.1 putative membrane protein [Labrenzia sp. EL_13]MBG6209450.1 putative membrane protein [Labrenzia sp. EL_126]MBG62
MNDQTDVAGYMEPGGKNATLIYILYLVSIIVGITSIIGVIFAYLNRGKAGGWVESHYTYQIRTFWIGLLYSLIGAVLTFVFIGIFVLIATLVWFIIRCIKGVQTAGRGDAISNPETWMF